MARRSRKRRKPRPRPAAPQADPAEAVEPVARPSSPDGPPPAPWGSFPLVELMVLGGIILLFAGLIVSGYKGTVMAGGGLALASLAGLELAVREHLAGYRSHSMLIAGVGAILTIIVLFLVAPELAPGARFAAGAAVFALGFLALRQLFKRRSGGASFRIGNFRG